MNRLLKYIYSSFPMIMFFLLSPFMLENVPYHSDLLGNIDARGSKMMMFIAIFIFSALLLYLYSHIKEKKVLFFIMSLMLIFMCTLLLLASVIKVDNLFIGFYNYFLLSFGNLMSFILFVIWIIFFIELGSKDALKKSWHNIKLYTLFLSLINLWIFLSPVISGDIKMKISSITIIIGLFLINSIFKMIKS